MVREMQLLVRALAAPELGSPASLRCVSKLIVLRHI